MSNRAARLSLAVSAAVLTALPASTPAAAATAWIVHPGDAVTTETSLVVIRDATTSEVPAAQPGGKSAKSGSAILSNDQDRVIMRGVPRPASHGFAVRVGPPLQKDEFNEFNGVAALSTTDAWAVGNACKSGCGLVETAGPTLIAHWNGTRWTRVSSPNEGNSLLAGVSAVSPSDIWAAGTTGGGNAFILHWNGAAWSIAASPVTGPASSLAGVAAVSGSDAWAVGYYCPSSSCATFRTLIMHWNGTAWSQVPSPNPGGSPTLSGVAALSQNDAWAVGDYCASACGKATETDHTLILHWNGTAWSQVPSPNPDPSGFPTLSAVTASSGTDAWAVGTRCISGCGTSANVFRALLLRWNGNTWSQAPSPSANVPLLFGAASASSASAWAVGTDIHFKPVILYWNGTIWSKARSPNPSSLNTLLRGAAATSPTDAWAAGYGGPLGGAGSTVILHWNGTAWSAVNSPNP